MPCVRVTNSFRCAGLTVSCPLLPSVDPRLRHLDTLRTGWFGVVPHIWAHFGPRRVRVVADDERVSLLVLDSQCPGFVVRVTWRCALDKVVLDVLGRERLGTKAPAPTPAPASQLPPQAQQQEAGVAMQQLQLGVIERKLVSAVINAACFWVWQHVARDIL